ncbi:MAG: hypothetical protein J0L72_10655 [Armatimonadetes bacterium]|nr:hypothetical protein [Armatimonadota bacterium]
MSDISRPFVHSVRLVWEHDPHGEPDYLERSAEDHFGVDGSAWSHVSNADKARVAEQFGSIWNACEHYAREDSERLQDFRAHNWWFESCRAEAEVRYETGDGCFRTERLTSAGLYGIESDSDQAYRRSVEQDELADLSSHLERFGVARSILTELVALTL